MKKYFILIFLFFNTYLYSFSGGSGTEADPYKISSLADWNIFADSIEFSPNTQQTQPGNWSYGKYFELTQDIGVVKTSVGRGGSGGLGSPNRLFEGCFDGKNNKITIEFIGSSDGGLFYHIGNATIKNLKVDGSINVSGRGAAIAIHANIYAANSSKIINCINYANINAGLMAGGIGADLYHTNIENCINVGTISVSGIAGGVGGGIVAHISGNSVTNCINIGTINGNLLGMGGIVGLLGTGGIAANNNINYGYVASSSVLSTMYGYGFGGMGGYIENNNSNVSIIISNNFNSGVVSAPAGSNVGSIVGIKIGGVTLQNNHYDKQMSMYDGINGVDIAGQAEGHLTKTSVGNGLSSKFGGIFTYIDSLYPQLPNRVGHTASSVGASPVFLYDGLPDFERHLTICRNFRVSRKNGVSWHSVNGRVRIEAQIGDISPATILSLGDDTLIASIGIYRKVVPIRIEECLVQNFNLVLRDSPEKISILTGEGEYPDGFRVPIEAIPNNNCYKFVSWTNENGVIISTKQKDTITLISDSVLIANFVRDSFNLALNTNPQNAGTATTSGRYACGDTVEFSATSNDCYRFVNWTNANGSVVSNNPKHTIIIAKDSVLTANFVREKFNLWLGANPSNAGTLTGEGEYDCDTEVFISATSAGECYRFVNWTSNGIFISADNPLLVVLSRDTTLIANFEKANDFEVKLSPNPANGGTVTGDGKFACPGTTITISATANTGFVFVNWTDAVTGAVFSTDTVVHFLVYRDFDLIANFATETDIGTKYRVDLRSDPVGGGVLTGAGWYDFDDKVQIKAVANPDRKFLYWHNLAGDTISRNAEFELTVKSDTVLIASFFPKSYYLVIYANPYTVGGITGTTQGVYPAGRKGTTTAFVKNPDFRFVAWTGGANKADTLSFDLTLEFIINSDTVIIANFEYDTISISENINPETLTISPNPTREHFTFSFEVVKSGNLEVKLLDLSGREALLIHNDFAHEGTFSRTINTTNLSRGVYYLKVQVGKNFTVEKVVVE